MNTQPSAGPSARYPKAGGESTIDLAVLSNNFFKNQLWKTAAASEETKGRVNASVPAQRFRLVFPEKLK